MNRVALIIAVAATIGGCATSPDTGGGAARSAVQTFRDACARATAQIDVMMAALDDISAMRGDTKEKYAELAYAVVNVEKQAAATRARREEMQAKRQAHIDRWEAEFAASKDPEIKERMTRDKAEAQKDFDRLVAALTKTRESYTPWIESLKTIKSGLEGDKLVPPNIVALRPKMAETQTQGTALKANITAVVSEVDRMARLRAARLE